MNLESRLESATTDLRNQATLLWILLEEIHDNLHNPGRLKMDEDALYVLHDAMSGTIAELDALAAEWRKRV